MPNDHNLISLAIEQANGVTPLAKHVGVSYQAMRRWEKNNRLPRTDLTGETNYAERMASFPLVKITKEEFHHATKSAWAKR